MGRFFGLWAVGTVFWIIAMYVVVFGFIGVCAFITFSVEPFLRGVEQMDWLAFRVTAVIAAIVGFVFALAELDH